MRKLRWQAGFFDWNGTLLDDTKLVWRIISAVFRKYKLKKISLEKLRGVGAYFYWKFYKKWGIPKHVKKRDTNPIADEYFRKYWKQTKLHPETRRCLRKLHKLGLRMLIVSGDTHDRVRRRLHQFKIKGFFEHVETGVKKKTKAFFSLTEQYDINPYKAFYVDDTLEGLRAAKQAGLTTFAFTQGLDNLERLKQAEPDAYINNLKELLQIIRSGHIPQDFEHPH